MPLLAVSGIYQVDTVLTR